MRDIRNYFYAKNQQSFLRSLKILLKNFPDAFKTAEPLAFLEHHINSAWISKLPPQLLSFAAGSFLPMAAANLWDTSLWEQSLLEIIDQADESAKLALVDIFLLQGKIPDGYRLEVIANQGSKVIATLLSDSISRPEMMLTVAFNEMYAGVERMNDLSAEDMETLKASYSSMNEVTFSETETAAGTKLLVVREAGSDEDFVSIFSIYKGYSVEFVLSPNPKIANATLTDAQIQTAIDFLSSLEFVPAN